MAGVEVVVLPPLPYLGDLIEDFEDQGRLEFGSQDVSCNEKGAYTGEVSAAMIADVGAKYGLVGHSERRQYHQESSELVARKFVEIGRAQVWTTVTNAQLGCRLLLEKKKRLIERSHNRV